MFVVDKPHDVDKEAKWMIKPIEALQSDIQASNSLFGLVSEASPLTQHRGPPPQHLRSPYLLSNLQVRLWYHTRPDKCDQRWYNPLFKFIYNSQLAAQLAASISANWG